MKFAIWPHYELRDGALRVPLTRQEGLIMTTLLTHREVDTGLLMDVLWPDPDKMPDLWYCSLTTCLHKLRTKLRLFRHTIATRWQFGWRLEDLQ